MSRATLTGIQGITTNGRGVHRCGHRCGRPWRRWRGGRWCRRRRPQWHGTNDVGILGRGSAARAGTLLNGRVSFTRSGRASIPAGRSHVISAPAWTGAVGTARSPRASRCFRAIARCRRCGRAQNYPVARARPGLIKGRSTTHERRSANSSWVTGRPRPATRTCRSARSGDWPPSVDRSGVARDVRLVLSRPLVVVGGGLGILGELDVAHGATPGSWLWASRTLPPPRGCWCAVGVASSASAVRCRVVRGCNGTCGGCCTDWGGLGDNWGDRLT